MTDKSECKQHRKTQSKENSKSVQTLQKTQATANNIKQDDYEESSISSGIELATLNSSNQATGTITGSESSSRPKRPKLTKI